MSHQQISLDALLLRDVAIQWFEGVAVVQSVCRHILGSPSQPAGFPAAFQIVLSKNGTVSTVGSSWSGDPVEGAARLLLDMGTGDMPVQLRLLLSQAAGLDGTYPTLNDFSTGLAYFERSSPHAILQQLFERAAGAAQREVPRPHASEAVPVQKQENPADKAKRQAAVNRAKQLVGAGLAAALALAAAWFFALGPGRAHLDAAGSSVMKQLGLGTPGEASPAAASSEPVEKGSRSGKTTSAATANTASQGQPSRKNTSDSKPDLPRVSSPKPAASAAMAVAPAAAGAPRSEPTPSVLDGIVTYVVPASPASPSEVADLLAEGGVRDGRLYSARDSTVVPPRNVYPVFPDPPADLEFRNKTVVDVVVNDNGLVEHVRLRNRPRDIHEFMLVSAAKAWRFEPATLDGRPVRFLHSLTIVRQ